MHLLTIAADSPVRSQILQFEVAQLALMFVPACVLILAGMTVAVERALGQPTAPKFRGASSSSPALSSDVRDPESPSLAVSAGRAPSRLQSVRQNLHDWARQLEFRAMARPTERDSTDGSLLVQSNRVVAMDVLADSSH